LFFFNKNRKFPQKQPVTRYPKSGYNFRSWIDESPPHFIPGKQTFGDAWNVP